MTLNIKTIPATETSPTPSQGTNPAEQSSPVVKQSKPGRPKGSKNKPTDEDSTVPRLGLRWPDEVCAALGGIHRHTFRKHVKNHGFAPTFRIGAIRMCTPDDVRGFIAKLQEAEKAKAAA